MLRYILFLFFCPILLMAQSEYESLEAQGTIPKEFITPSTVKYKRQIEQLDSKKMKKRSKKDRKAFYLQSNFAIDDMMQSGLVLFNDEVTNYVNEVLEVILEANPKLKRKKPRAYVLQSPIVNAFATDQGIVFVSLGLLANLENEAQLAYILSHELTHIEKRHTINSFLKNKDIDKEKDKSLLRRSAFDQKMLAKSIYSQKLETEADHYGLELFKKTDYSTTTLPTVFEILYFAYLPFNDIPFPTTFFNHNNYQIPQSYWPKEINAISAFGEGDEEEQQYSTHPSAPKRLAKLKVQLNKTTPKDTSFNYLVSQERFESVRQIARHEIPMQYLHQGIFGYAIYCSHLLLQENPDQLYPKKIIAKALYSTAKFKNANEETEELPEYLSKIEGASHAVFHMLEKMPARELNVLALQYTQHLRQSHPKDQELKTIAFDLCKELAQHDDTKLSDFQAAIKQASTPVDTTEVTQKQSIKQSKYENIKAAQQQKQVKDSTNYWQYAFESLLKDTSFVTLLEEGREKYEKREAWADEYYSYKNRKNREKEYKIRAKKGARLGIKKVMVVNPYFMSVDARPKKKAGVKHIKSEQKQEQYRLSIKDIARKTNLKVGVLDVTGLKKGDVNTFNDIRHLNTWFEDQTMHYDLSLTPGFNQAKIDAIAEKYDTDYFLWTGTVSLRVASDKSLLYYSILFFPILPIGLAKAVTPDYDFLHYAILFDVKTGRRSVIKMEYYEEAPSNAMMRSHLYDTFMQINSKK